MKGGDRRRFNYFLTISDPPGLQGLDIIVLSTKILFTSNYERIDGMIGTKLRKEEEQEGKNEYISNLRVESEIMYN